MSDLITLDTVKIGSEAKVHSCLISGALKRRIIDFGIVEGANIKCVGKSTLGDPHAYSISGTVVAIRKKDAKQIMVYSVN